MIQPSDLRSLIPDKPVSVPSPQDSPEAVGRGDGNTTVFYLKKSNSVAGSLVVYSSTDSQTWTQMLASWTIDATGQIITFSVAPANGLYIGARYQVQWFTDAELDQFITYSYQRPYSSDYQFSLHAKMQALSILMTSPELVLIKHFGDRYDDITELMNGYKAQIALINSELMGQLTPDKATPSAVIVDGGYRPYVPRR